MGRMKYWDKEKKKKGGREFVKDGGIELGGWPEGNTVNSHA